MKFNVLSCAVLTMFVACAKENKAQDVQFEHVDLNGFFVDGEDVDVKYASDVQIIPFDNYIMRPTKVDMVDDHIYVAHIFGLQSYDANGHMLGDLPLGGDDTACEMVTDFCVDVSGHRLLVADYSKMLYVDYDFKYLSTFAKYAENECVIKMACFDDKVFAIGSMPTPGGFARACVFDKNRNVVASAFDHSIPRHKIGFTGIENELSVSSDGLCLHVDASDVIYKYVDGKLVPYLEPDFDNRMPYLDLSDCNQVFRNGEGGSIKGRSLRNFSEVGDIQRFVVDGDEKFLVVLRNKKSGKMVGNTTDYNSITDCVNVLSTGRMGFILDSPQKCLSLLGDKLSESQRQQLLDLGPRDLSVLVTYKYDF